MRVVGITVVVVAVVVHCKCVAIVVVEHNLACTFEAVAQRRKNALPYVSLTIARGCQY